MSPCSWRSTRRRSGRSRASSTARARASSSSTWVRSAGIPPASSRRGAISPVRTGAVRSEASGADLARAQRRRAGRVPSPRISPQPRVRRNARISPRLSLRRGGARRQSVSRRPRRTHPLIAGHDACRPSDAYVAPSELGLLDEALPDPPTAPDEPASAGPGFAMCGGSTLSGPPVSRPPGLGQRTSCWPRASWPPTACSTRAAAGRCGSGGTTQRSSARSRDSGRIEEPLAGRGRPTPDRASGRGLWLVNQLCDLVQMRVLPAGNVVRLRMSLS